MHRVFREWGRHLFPIHIIDDDEAVRHSFEALLTVLGYSVDTFPSAESYIAYLERPRAHDAACVLLDIQMPVMNGFDLLRVLVVRCPSLPVLLLTAASEDRLRREALRLGAVDCLTKPVPGELLVGTIERIRTENAAGRPM